MSLDKEKIHEILISPEFKSLVRKRVSVSLSFTFLMLAVYFGFILLMAFNKEFLATKIGEHITLGIPFGIGIIIFAWLLTGIYIIWANNSYDKKVNEIRNQIINK